jgi:tRNA pseudouridine55 synthase
VLFIDKYTPISKEEIQAKAQEDGLFFYIDKPKGWTSFDVVAKMRNLLRIKKRGHTGTLDPMATGLLIVAVGRGATKQIDNLMAKSKKYIATMKIGATTQTDDTEAEEENLCDISHITNGDINLAFENMQGNILQIPPMHSAKKINGKKLYDLARQNIEIDLKPSEVVLYENKVKTIDLPSITFEVHCSKGTYIRAIARDIGESLRVGGYLTDLRRTQIEEHNVEGAITITELEQRLISNENI